MACGSAIGYHCLDLAHTFDMSAHREMVDRYLTMTHKDCATRNIRVEQLGIVGPRRSSEVGDRSAEDDFIDVLWKP